MEKRLGVGRRDAKGRGTRRGRASGCEAERRGEIKSEVTTGPEV